MLNEKIKFIIYFILIFIVFLFVGLNFFAIQLIDFQVMLIKNILGSIFNYASFIFVAECSGIISISVYLSVILALVAIKIKVNRKMILISIICLFLINILRLIIILASEKVSLLCAQIIHTLSWFLLIGIIFWLILKTKK
jgi:exosortase/archaeosortase family protein